MKFLVPLVLAVTGAGAGIGAGVMLRPDAAAADQHGAGAERGDTGGGHAADPHATAGAHAPEAAAAGGHDDADDGHGGAAGGAEYVKLNNQFIVPILENARVRSLVVLSVDLEVAPGQTETIYRIEPKLRDAFLTVLFDHANAGGFNGTFTSSGSMDILRKALRESGRKAVGEALTDVLITGIVRQEV